MSMDWDAFEGVSGFITKAEQTGKNRGRIVEADRSASTLQRKKRINPKSLRHAEKKAIQDGPQAAHVRTMPCVRCAKEPWSGAPTQAHHEPPRSLGGRDEDAVPLCAECHNMRTGTTAEEFWTEVGADPEDVKAFVRSEMAAGGAG